MPRRNNLFLLLAAGLQVFLTGCAHYPLNTPLSSTTPQSSYRFENLPKDENTDSLFIALTFSGGGTRAAALSYGVMQALKGTPIVWKGKKKSLVDEVDLISSVSGGSFTSAYYGLFGDKIFTDFEPRFLKRDIQHELFYKLFQPWTAYKILSPYYSRIDMAAEIYNETVFERKKFSDLLTRNRKPFLILNATNLYLGERFEFTQDQFDLLGSDLLNYPVARAVAASSAFPVLLSPISLKNFGGDPKLASALWIQNALKDYDLNRRRFMRAKNTLVYLDPKNHPYIHLMDGGLSDNIGLRGLIESMTDPDNAGGIRQLLNDGKIERFLIIIVNAKNAPPENMDASARAPSLSKVAMKTATISMDNYSFETVEAVKSLTEDRKQAERAIADCQKELDRVAPGRVKLPTLGKSPQFYIVEVSFDSIEDLKEREAFLSLPTAFTLKPQEVDQLEQKGRDLLGQSEDFKKFLKDIE